MRYGSVCSGIEAASVAWEPLGWQPAWFAEIEPFPAAVLSHRWPSVPNHGDITALAAKILSGEVEAPDVLVGGTPCQAFSVAGLRGSLDDARGNLTLVLVRLLNAIDFVRQHAGKPPCLLVWENVPGVLSTKDNAFGCFLGGLAGEDLPLEPAGKKWTNAGAVYGYRRHIAWRVLDAQFFGVPQRRRRVFLVAGTGACRADEILFERESLRGDIDSGTAAGQIAAAATGSSLEAMRMRGFGDYVADRTASTVKARDHKDATDLIVVQGRQDPCASDEAFALDCQSSGNTNVLCIRGNIIDRSPGNGGNGLGVDAGGISPTLTATYRHAVAYGLSVRRLTPTECERLQGFPDGHTLIPWRGKPAAECPDSPRYKALGNSMAVPVMRWIGNRIKNGKEKKCTDKHI